jgi:hypothetical protein
VFEELDRFSRVRVINPAATARSRIPWLAFAAEWSAAVGSERSVQFQVRGVNTANPTVVGSAPPRVVQLSNEELLGGVYYWAATAANGPFGIFRHDMSKPGQPAEQYMTTAQTNGRCVACHVLSRDGTKMTITYDGNGPATFVDVARSKVARPSTRGLNFGTFTPDGNKFLAIQHGQLTVLDSSTQATLATMTSRFRVAGRSVSRRHQLVYTRPAGTTRIISSRPARSSSARSTRQSFGRTAARGGCFDNYSVLHPTVR